MNSAMRQQAWRRGVRYVVAATLLIGVPIAAEAAQVSGFTGPYDPSNWSTSIGLGDGSVDTSNAPDSIEVTGADNGAAGTNTDFTIAAAGTGFWSFDFVWDNLDDQGSLGPCCDFGGFLHNGVFTQYGTGADISGSQPPIAVVAGDIIGYRVNCSDCIEGPGVLTISNFSAPVDEVTPPAVPEPGIVILLGLGAAGCALRRLGRRSR
jgi:PEP-CTERM motif